MSKLILDTSVIIDFLRQKEKTDTVLYKLSLENNVLYISILTHTELYAGKSTWEGKNARSELETLFGGLHILPLTEKISENAGQVRAKYGIGLIDAIIASTALLNNIPLVTLNTKHFEQVENLEIHS